MAVKTSNALQGPDDPEPVLISPPSDPQCPLLLIGDHAGNAVPERLDALGLDDESLHLHIAVDLGVEQLGREMSRISGAAFVRQVYSRLVIDCNRAPDAPGSIAASSDGHTIAGNVSLSQQARNQRRRMIFDPYQEAIASQLDRMRERELQPILISLHSFTPVLGGLRRPWDIGVLHAGANDSFAREVLAALRASSDLTIGDNEPYRMDQTDYTVPFHAFGSGMPYIELEVRQDVLSDRLEMIADLLTRTLQGAVPAD